MTFEIEEENPCYNETHICTFRLVNGSVLTCIGVLGFLMSSSVISLILVNVIRLPGNKNIFILNVSMFDAMLAVIGTIRGLGIINKSVLGVHEDLESWGRWCEVFTLIAAPLWDSVIITLLPLTTDRFIAVMFPTKYRRIVTNKTSVVMVLLSWLPLIGLLLHDVITYLMGTLKIEYYMQYNRCIYMNPWEKQQAVYLLGPFLVICTLYSIMLVNIIKNKINATKMILTTTIIILTSILVSQPFMLMASFGLGMSYVSSQILTVTCYYLSAIVNPVIYLCCNRRVQKQVVENLQSRIYRDRVGSNVFSSVGGHGGSVSKVSKVSKKSCVIELSGKISGNLVGTGKLKPSL